MHIVSVLQGDVTCVDMETLKPIFHWKLGSHWLPNANEINTKNMKCTCPTPEFCVGTQRNLYSTGLRLGLASGKTQILGLASGVWPMPGPDANGFASQWNIGFSA